MEYTFRLQVHVKARRSEDSLALLNHYRDVIRAILQDIYTLGETSLDVACDNEDPSIPFTEGSEIYRVGMVNVKITAWVPQGQTTLP
jgi:hypothetical protein